MFLEGGEHLVQAGDVAEVAVAGTVPASGRVLVTHALLSHLMWSSPSRR